MKTRKLTWDDVQASLTWVQRNGRRRVFASLKGCSCANTTLWCDNPDLESPTLQAAILLNLHRSLRKTVYKIRTYVESVNDIRTNSGKNL